MEDAQPRRLAQALPWLLLLLFFVRGLLAMRADGTTVDEPLHLFYGQRALASGTFLRDHDFLNSKMPVSVLNALPVAMAARGRTLSWQQQLLLARLPTLLLGVILGWLVWRWALALFGPVSGLLGLYFYTFCPNVLAHAHLVTTDLATALAMFAATYCLWRYLDAPSHRRLLLAASLFGVAQLTKATALFLLPIFAIILAFRSARAPGGRAARGALLLLACCLAAVLALNLGFCCEGTGTPLDQYAFVSPPFQSLAVVPLLRSVPLPLPHAYLQGLDMVARDSRAGDWSYLRGRYSQTGFRSYFLWAFLVKVPLATQAVLLIALGLWASRRVRAPGAERFLLVPVAVLLLYLSFFLSSTSASATSSPSCHSFSSSPPARRPRQPMRQRSALSGDRFWQPSFWPRSPRHPSSHILTISPISTSWPAARPTAGAGSSTRTWTGARTAKPCGGPTGRRARGPHSSTPAVRLQAASR